MRRQTNHTRRPQLPRAGAEAVVLGGSMAGLLAATVLADAYDHVTLVERDHLYADGKPRRGVPQGRHVHVLLPRGSEVIEELLPGILDELVDSGGGTTRSLRNMHFELNGHVLNQDDSTTETPLHRQSRPLLESRLLERVLALGNVTMLDGHEVGALRADDRGRVVGVTVSPSQTTAPPRDLPADLVMVATGRSGRVGAWLKELGYAAPVEESVRVDVMYASREMILDPELTGDTEMVLVGPTAERPCGCGVFAQENGTWMVTLGGFAGHHPPTEHGEWLEFSDRVLPPKMAKAVRTGEALTGIQGHRFPANLRRRYDKLERFPEGLLVTGDAVCSFNPIYGQGMTVAALEALALRDTLRRRPQALAPRYFKAAAKPVSSAWQFAVGADLALPPEVVPGPRPLPVRVMGAYIDRYQRGAERDAVLAWHFLKVTGFDEPVRTLFGPSSLSRIFRPARSRRPAPARADQL